MSSVELEGWREKFFSHPLRGHFPSGSCGSKTFEHLSGAFRPASLGRIIVSRRVEGLLCGELQGNGPEVKQAGVFDTCLALSNVPEGASESSCLGAVIQDLLAAGSPGFAQNRRSCSWPTWLSLKCS